MKPMIFSGPMVRAILKGRKTQTRRVMKPQPTMPSDPSVAGGVYADWYNNGPDMAFWLADNRMTEARVWHPPYAVGDRLWVRETFFEYVPDHNPGVHCVGYRADAPVDAVGPHMCRDAPSLTPIRWRPAIFMPRWASRLTLEVTAVRAERLQEISEEDAVAEGAGNIGGAIIKSEEFGAYLPAASYQYGQLWDSLNAKRGHLWDSNPWVWVYGIRRADS
jgi:hypothetical protein